MAFLAALLVAFLLYPVLSFLPILGPLLTGILAGLGRERQDRAE